MQAQPIETTSAMNHRMTSLGSPQAEKGKIITLRTSRNSTGIHMSPINDTTSTPKDVLDIGKLSFESTDCEVFIASR